MDNPGDEAPAASADPSANEPIAMQVENPSSPDVTAGNGKKGNEADVSPAKPTSMDIDSLSTGQTAGRESNANALITASSNTSASAAPTIGTNSSSTPSATIIFTHACFLCCRKFTSLEQLLKHQAKSKLHRTNLEREKALKKEKEKEESESKSDAGQDAQAEKGEDSSDGSNRDDDEDDDSDVDSEGGDGNSSTARSSKPKYKSSKRSSSKPRRPSVRSRTEGPVQVWRCSSCNDAYFDTYEEAFEHEARCARRGRRESSTVDSSSEGDMDDDDEVDNERTKELRAVARAKAKEREALEQKKWKEEDAQLKAKGIEQSGKGVPFNLTAEDKKILSDYNGFLFENIEMFVVDQEFNDQLAASGTGSGKHRAQGTVGLRCVHCKYRPYGERAASSCVFPGRLSIFSTHLHQIVSTHFPHCQSLPDDFHEQVKTHKDKLPMQSYLHGFLGINAFMEKHGTDRWNLEESTTTHGLQFAGTELVLSDSDSDNEIVDDAKNRKGAKSTSNISSSATSDDKEISTPSTKKRSISGGDTSSEKPKKKRGRPRLSDMEKQRREEERKKGRRERKEKKKKKNKKRKKKTPEDLLLESIEDQVPFGLSKSDPKDLFSPLHKLLREATEVFVIRTRYEAIDLTPFGDPLLKVGSCGLRCKFCQDHCVFPAHVEDIYNKVRRGIQDHISSGECDAMTPSLKRRYFAVENEARSPNISTLYRSQAKEVGLYDIGEREGLGLRGVSTALINANIEGSDSSSSSSSNANSDGDGEDMSVSSSSSSAEDGSDNETAKNEVRINSTAAAATTTTSNNKTPISARNAADVCNHPGCNKYKQARCEGFCIRHYRESRALFDSDLSSSDEKGPKLCSVSGCTKASRSDGNGMCRRHHTESVKRKNSKRDKSPTSTTDRPKEAKGGRICSVPGCTKLFQYKCNGMCYRHHSASKKESNEAGLESSNNSSDDSSSSSSESEIEHPLVSDLLLRDERSSMSPYRLKLLSSLQLCYLSPKDAAKNHKRKDLPLGMPGVRCKYCHTQKVFGIADTLWFNVSKGKQKSHLDECPGIHYKQKLHLDRLEREEDESDRSMFSAAVPKSLRANIYKRMVERATSEKYLSKKAGKKLLKTAKERDSSSRKR